MGSVDFKINSRPLFKLKNVNFKTRDFSPHIKRVITVVKPHSEEWQTDTSVQKQWSMVRPKSLVTLHYEIPCISLSPTCYKSLMLYTLVQIKVKGGATVI